MQFSILRRLRQMPRAETTVSRDAEELLQLWGAVAYEKATDLSWREDSGLVPSPRPGHWWNVRREVGQRLGRQEKEPVAGFAA